MCCVVWAGERCTHVQGAKSANHVACVRLADTCLAHCTCPQVQGYLVYYCPDSIICMSCQPHIYVWGYIPLPLQYDMAQVVECAGQVAASSV